MTDADRLARIWIFDSPYILMDWVVVCVVNEHEVTVVTVWNLQQDTLGTYCICCKMVYLLHDPLPMEILDKFLLLLIHACYCCFLLATVAACFPRSLSGVNSWPLVIEPLGVSLLLHSCYSLQQGQLNLQVTGDQCLTHGWDHIRHLPCKIVN